MSAHARYPRSLSPVQLGNVELRNRIFVPAHTTNYGEDHLPSRRHLSYHRARARGGVGLIIFESVRVHPSSLGKVQGIAGFDPRCIEPFRRIAEAVHAEGAKLFGQVIHLGRQVDADAVRVAPWGASPIPWDATAPVPHEMTPGDISALVEGHVATARNLIEAGLDGIEVHLGHGHLLQQFLSPASNRRTDEYGGSEENRMRLSLDVLDAVRTELGPGICMGVRVSADEFLPGGLTVRDMERIVPAVLDRVQLDFVDVSHSAYHGSYTLATQMADMSLSPAPFRNLTRRIAGAVRRSGHKTPILAVCKFRTLGEAEDVLRRGDADLIGMARAHIADPNLVMKAVTDTGPIRLCVGCNQGCAGFLERGHGITCLVNPSAGREEEWTTEPRDDPAETPRRVLVIGGGPAGLEAAWVAAARGHRVRLWETRQGLGGQLTWLRFMPLRHDFLGLVEHQKTAARNSGVDVTLGKWATPQDALASGADTVILATGSTEDALELELGGTAAPLTEALQRPWDLGSRVAFYDTAGSWASVSVAEYLARLGKRVSIFVPAAGFAWDVTRYSKPAIVARLRQLGVRIRLSHRVLSAEGARIEVEDMSTAEVVPMDGFDSVVAPGPRRRDVTLSRALEASGITAIEIGDCVAPRTALEAVFEGHRAARNL